LGADKIIPVMLAFFVGIGLCFALPITLGTLLGDDTPLMQPVIVAAYGVSGIAFGYFWPEVGWRLGLCLFAVWLPVILFALLMSDTAGPVNWKDTLHSLLDFMMILVAACFGAEVGAIIGRQRRAKTSGA